MHEPISNKRFVYYPTTNKRLTSEPLTKIALGASCKTHFIADFKGNEIMQTSVFIDFNFPLV